MGFPVCMNRVQKRALDLLDLELHAVVSCLTWVLCKSSAWPHWLGTSEKSLTASVSFLHNHVNCAGNVAAAPWHMWPVPAQACSKDREL